MDQFTIASDDEIEPEVLSDEEHINSTGRDVDSDDEEIAAEFVFDDGLLDRRRSKLSKKKEKRSSADDPEMSDNLRAMPHVEERAERANKKSKQKVALDAMNKGNIKAATAGEEGGNAAHGDEELDDNNVGTEDEGDEEAVAQAAYFDEIVDHSGENSGQTAGEVQFSQLNLSRSLLRAVERAGYTNPTPIQSRVIPLALSGRDVCASAVTGSGKTAAFVLPFLERLLYRPKEVAAIRVLVLTPTRELATQIYEVLVKLSVFTDITSALICGGKKDLRSQEATLRGRPDVIVCTPGRIVDHLRNSMSITLDDLDVLVLDEVDRLLELGFQEEIEELLRFCPSNRQTLLFSATMTTKVEDLVRLSLKKPVRVKVNVSSTAVAPRLVQEFVKLRDAHEREAHLCSLVCRSFGHRVIVFFETKVEAHRFAAILKLMDVKVAELHGNLQQSQRYAALTDFRENKVDVLVCTDVAARGLDIPGVQCVINSEMPRTASSYVHRVGRTARAGCGGRSITLVTDARRKIMKEVLKGNELGGGPTSVAGSSNSSGDSNSKSKNSNTAVPQILTRSVPSTVISHYVTKIASLESRIIDLFHEESVASRIADADREIEKAQNLLKFEEEISARPARTWYMTETQKQAIKTASTEASKNALLQQNNDGEDAAAADNEAGLTSKVSKKLQRKEEARAKNPNGGHVGGDNYVQSEKDRDAEVSKHRLSRIKRRRLEAMKAVEEETSQQQEKKRKLTDDGDQDAGDRAAGKSKGKKSTPAPGDDSLSAMFARKNPKKARYTQNGASKVIRQSFATGGLDTDMRQWGMLQQHQQPQSEGSAAGKGGKKGGPKVYASREERELKEFKAYDPSKKGLGKKKGHQAFKSKTKYKRR